MIYVSDFAKRVLNKGDKTRKIKNSTFSYAMMKKA